MDQDLGISNRSSKLAISMNAPSKVIMATISLIAMHRVPIDGFWNPGFHPPHLFCPRESDVSVDHGWNFPQDHQS
jgi:hypothetical protein